MKDIIEIKYYIDKFELSNILDSSIIPYINIKNYKKNSLILESGSVLNHLSFLVEGEAEVAHMLEDGGHTIINVLKPLSIFGDLEYLCDHKTVFQNVLSLQKNTKLLCIDYKYINDILSENVYFWKCISKDAINKLTKKNIFMIKKLHSNLQNLIISILEDNNGIFIFSTLESLSKELNVSYRNLTRVLKKLNETNVIRREKNKIILISSLKKQKKTLSN